MKGKSFIFFLFLTSVVLNIGFSREERIERKTRVYFSARVSKPQYQQFNLDIRDKIFNENYQVFMPQSLFIPELDFETIERCAYEADKAAIDWSDIVFLLSPYGKDCAWEIGYAKGKNKFIIGFLSDRESINDSMVIGSLHLAVTDDPEIMSVLATDGRTKDKCLFLKEGSFDRLIKPFYHRECHLKEIFQANGG
ncbi:MAG: nucleoside 2-deoxyribosyltransferase [Chlamydiota bacterium]